MNVRSLLATAAQDWPERTAVIDEAGSLTFAELDAEVARLSADLKAAGVRPGHGLGVMCRNGRGFLIAVFAGLGCGGVVMPISHHLKAAELADLLERSKLHAMLDDGSGVRPAGVPTPLRGELSLVWTDVSPGLPFVPHVPDAAFVRFTSGTTGASKGVVISHRAVLARTAAAREALDLSERDVVVWVLPMSYHFIVTIVMYVRYGATIVVSRDMLGSTLLDAVEQHAGTLLYAAPMHYRMLAADTSGRQLDTVRLAVSTSTAMPRQVALDFHGRYDLPISQVYGIIEIGLPAGNIGLDPDHPDTIGCPLPQHEVAIVDDAGEPVPPGESGHLVMRGPGMFDAYLCPPRPVSDVLVNGWFYTGDLARQIEGGLIQVAGRAKSMINCAGLKVFPEEVEAVLDAHPDVLVSQVEGVPHEVMGEVVAARVVPRPGVQLQVGQLRRYCRSQLSTFKVPQYIEVVESLEFTGSGKRVRHATPEERT